MRKQKNGNMIYFALAFILLFTTLAGIFINVSSSWEVYNRVQVATEEGAKVRAQAVDIFLKEAAGIVEVIHDVPSVYDPTGGEDVDHGLYTSVVGHTSPHEPTTSEYVQARIRADEGAKDAILSVLDYSLTNNVSGNEILEGFSKDNICIQVKPLPRTDNDGKFLDFSCTTPLGETVKANNVRVSPVESELNQKVIFDPDGVADSGDEHITEVVNVVFVGVAFEHNHFIEGLFKNMNINTKAHKKVWAISYPQIDQCFGEFC